MSLSSLQSNSSVVHSRLIILAALAFGVTIAPLSGAAIADPAGDFLTTFTTGPKNGDLDVLRAEVFFDGTNFTFTSTENGPIGTTDGSVFVWGVDRGLHNQFFQAFRPGVLFDVAVILFPNLTGTVFDFSPANAAPPIDLAPGSVTVNGNTIQAVVPASFLPSRGLQPADYQVNFLPRVGLHPANNAEISDFAPDNSDVGVTTPEPSTMLLFGGGLIALASSRRRFASLIRSVAPSLDLLWRRATPVLRRQSRIRSSAGAPLRGE